MQKLPGMRKRKWPSFDHCLYCEKPFPQNELTDEHIVPSFLGGTWKIKAACATCAKESNEFYEQDASNSAFYSIRAYLNLRKVGLKLPDVALGDFVEGQDSDFNVPLSVENRPHIFSFIEFSIPGILDEKFNSRIVPLRVVFMNFRQSLTIGRCYVNRSTYKNKTLIIIRYNVLEYNITIEEKVFEDAYLKTIAKIAYCYAVGVLGLSGFNGRSIRQILKGIRYDTNCYVGSISDNNEKFSDEYLHNCYLRKRGNFLTVVVHLFAALGMQPYEVVLCEWDGELPE